MLAGSTTGTCSNVSGNGVVMVLNTTNPLTPTVLEKLTIPGMETVTGIQVNGSQAFVIGSSGGWNSGGNLGLTGNLVVATLNLSNPTSPTVVSSQTLNVPSIGIGQLLSLGNNLYLTDSVGGGTNFSPQLYVIDDNDPSDVVATAMAVPNNVPDTGYVTAGNLLFTTDNSNLSIYQIGQPQDTPVVAQVTVPTGNGVSIVSGSFSVAPTTMTTGASSETLTWDLGFSAGDTSQAITWQEAVTGVQPGQALAVAQGGSVQFVSQGTSGTLGLPAQAVTGDQIIGMTPATQTVAPAAPASYTVTLSNPTGGAVTYSLSVQGLPAGWVNLPSSVQVPANGSTQAPLVLTSDAFAAVGNYGFSVSASDTAGAVASVQANLVLQGQAPAPDPESHGIVAVLTPAQASAAPDRSHYVVQLTNTGSSDDTVSLSLAGLPAGIAASFGQTTIDVPPGASNFRDVPLTLTPQSGAKPGSVAFTVNATSTTMATVTMSAAGRARRRRQRRERFVQPGFHRPRGRSQRRP